jgi:hypothetical protein
MALEPVRQAMTHIGVDPDGLRWKTAVFDRLPPDAEGISNLQRLAGELTQVQVAAGRLDSLRAELVKLGRETQKSQRSARIRTRDQLLQDRRQ